MSKVRYLKKKVVLYCIAFTSLVVVAGLVVCWRTGFDPTGVVTAAIGFFGTNAGAFCWGLDGVSSGSGSDVSGRL